MKMHRIFALIGVLLLLPMLCLPAFAAENTGTLYLRCSTRLDEERLYFTEDEFSLAKIADAQVTIEDNKQVLHYTMLPEYQSLDCDWGNLTAEDFREKAKAAATIAAQKNEYVVSATVDEQGNVAFTHLAPALYLVVCTKTTSQHTEYFVEPFLVSSPMQWDGDLVYTVTASPKYEWVEPKPTEPPPTPVAPSQVSTPVLPQTGQLSWPVPVLLVLGVVLILIGWKKYK